MKTKTIIMSMLIATALSLALNSCKKDDGWTNQISVTYPNATELLPMTIGNYWVFYAWDYNANFQKINSTLTTDSLVVVGTEQINGSSAWILEHYSNNTLMDSLFFHVTDTTIRRYMTIHDTMPAGYGPRWVTVYQKGSELTTDYIEEFKEIKPFFDTNLVALVRFATHCSKDFDSTIAFAGKEYKTTQLEQVIQYSEQYIDSVRDSNSVMKYFNTNFFYFSNIYYNFYPQIGFMGMKKNPYIRALRNFDGNYKGHLKWTEYYPGKLYSLLRYRVK